MPEARQLFNQGIEAADRAGDLSLYANGWNRLGEEYLKRGELARAEAPLLEAYRVRKLNHLALDVSYRSLGRLRLEQGDLTSAAALLDRAVELSAQPQGWIPTWDIYHYRGRVRMAQGRLRDAMADLRIAVRLARDWRWNAPPDDASRMGTEGWLELVHSALVEAGNRLYLETGDPALIRETFEAAEENRAGSLRAVLSRGRTARSFRIAARLLGNAGAAATRRSAGPAHAGRAEPGNGRRCPRRTGAHGSGPWARPWRRCHPPCWNALARRWMTIPRCSVFNWATASRGCGPWTARASRSTPCRRVPRWNRRRRRRHSAIREDAAPGGDAPAQLWRTLFGQLAPRFQRQDALAGGAGPRLDAHRFAGPLHRRRTSLRGPAGGAPGLQPPTVGLPGRAPRDRDDPGRSLLGGSQEPYP